MEYPIKINYIPLVSSFIALIALLPSFNAETVYAVDRQTIIQAKIATIFPDAPIMQTVAKCESGLHQDAVNEKTKDFGTFQIHESWLPVAKNFGMDIVNNVDDNILFARYLFNIHHGLKDWSASAVCWQKNS